MKNIKAILGNISVSVSAISEIEFLHWRVTAR